MKIGEAIAGVGLYAPANTTVRNTQYGVYAVTAVATNGVSPSQALANRLMADGVTIDKDGDGIPDWWQVHYFWGVSTDLSYWQALTTARSRQVPVHSRISRCRRW